MLYLRRLHEDTIHFDKFRRPVFHITVLYIDEDVSIERQLKRGREQMEHNRIVDATGVGTKIDIRSTDLNTALASERYKQFKDHVFASLQQIKTKFPFHFINAEGSIDEVKSRILRV